MAGNNYIFRAVREQKNAKCTPVFRIGQHMLTNTEKINKTAEAPWHRIDERVKIRVPPAIPGKPQKLKWARQHKRLLRKIKTKPEELTVYTDGLLSHDQGVWRTGARIVAFCRGEALFQHRIALGEFAEVYNAKMEGLASGAEAVLEWLAQTGPRHGNTVLCRQHRSITTNLQRDPRTGPGSLPTLPQSDPPHSRYKPRTQDRHHMGPRTS